MGCHFLLWVYRWTHAWTCGFETQRVADFCSRWLSMHSCQILWRTEAVTKESQVVWPECATPLHLQAARLSFSMRVSCLFPSNGGQFNFKLRGGIRWNHTKVTTWTLGNAGKANQLGFSTNLHQLHAFIPARNNRSQRKIYGLIAFVWSVKFFAVFQWTKNQPSCRDFCPQTAVSKIALNTSANKKCFEMFMRHFRLKPEFFKRCDV